MPLHLTCPHLCFHNVVPVADAGLSQSAVVGQSVTLNGSGSTDANGDPLTYKWSVVSTPTGSKATISNPTVEIASLTPDVAGTFVVQLIVNDGTINSVPATTEIMAVAQATSLTQQIRHLQAVVANLPRSAFRNIILKDTLLIELNAVLCSVNGHNYKAALSLLQGIILPQIDGCATGGRIDKNDWITNCADQSAVYTPLLNVIAQVKGLVPAPTPTPTRKPPKPTPTA